MLNEHIACQQVTSYLEPQPGNQSSVRMWEIYTLFSLTKTGINLSTMPCLLRHGTVLHILCKVSPWFIDTTALMFQTIENIIISTSRFQLSFCYIPFKGTRIPQWLTPISVSPMMHLKTRTHLCLFGKYSLVTPFELPKESELQLRFCRMHRASKFEHLS